MGKITKTPFSGLRNHASNLLRIIHTDVCGPPSISTSSGSHYFINFTNDLIRYVYPLTELLVWKVWWVQTNSEWSRKMNLTRKSISRDTDRGEKDLSYGFSAYHWKTCEKSFTNYAAMKHHGAMVYLRVIVVLYVDSVWRIISLVKLLLSFELGVRIKNIHFRETI